MGPKLSHLTPTLFFFNVSRYVKFFVWCNPHQEGKVLYIVCGAKRSTGTMKYLIDAHCHVSTSLQPPETLELGSVEIERCVMSNNFYDWKTVKLMNHKSVHRCFGVHPWHSHLFSSDLGKTKVEHYQSVLRCKNEKELDEMIALLPDPINIDSYLQNEFDEKAECIGEIGLDKLFRLPKNGFFQEPREELSLVRVDMNHQIKIFEKLLDTAAREKLPISVHSVKCHGLLLEICQKKLSNTKVNICLHSFSGSIETLKLWFKTFKKDRIYFSISSYINLKNKQEAENLLKNIPIQNVLTETDYPIDQYSLDEQSSQLIKVIEAISSAHNVSDEYVINKVKSNFDTFLM